MIEFAARTICHIREHIDVIFVASITLLGFMITAMSILSMITPHRIRRIETLHSDILKMFKVAIYLLLASTTASFAAFVCVDCAGTAMTLSVVSVVILAASFFFVYKSVSIIFTLEEAASRG